MRRCFHYDYPRRETRDDQGRLVRIVFLDPIRCTFAPSIRSSITWPHGERQHTYTCAVHESDLKKRTEQAGFEWHPVPYQPKA